MDRNLSLLTSILLLELKVLEICHNRGNVWMEGVEGIIVANLGWILDDDYRIS